MIYRSGWLESLDTNSVALHSHVIWISWVIPRCTMDILDVFQWISCKMSRMCSQLRVRWISLNFKFCVWQVKVWPSNFLVPLLVVKSNGWSWNVLAVRQEQSWLYITRRIGWCYTKLCKNNSLAILLPCPVHTCQPTSMPLPVLSWNMRMRMKNLHWKEWLAWKVHPMVDI